MEEIKEEKKEKKGKNGLVLIILVLLVMVIGLGAFIYTKKDVLFVKPEKEIESTEYAPKENGEKTNIENDAVTFDLTEAEKILVKFGLSPDSTLKAYGGVYDSIGYTEDFKLVNAIVQVDESKIEKDICSRLYLGTDKADYITNQGTPFYREKDTDGICNDGDEVLVIKYDDVNEVYKDLYGKDAEKKAVSLLGYYYKFYDYYEEKDEFVSLKCNGCGGSFALPVYEIREASIKNDILTIKVAYDYPEVLGPNSYSIAGETINASSEEIENIILTNYIDKIANYKITFKVDGNHYTFKDMEKTN